MTIAAFKKKFRDELSEIYSGSESEELFYIFSKFVLNTDKFETRRIENENLDSGKKTAFENYLLKLKTGQPYQQILGETEFFGMKFFLNEHVLIPRPETEELLEIAIEKIQNSKFKIQNFRILDIGTGSGIIPIILKKHFPEAEISAIDFSESALKIAQKNAESHQADIHFIQQNYLENEPENVYDIIISNPPYIGIDEETDIDDCVKGFEPKMALFSPVTDALIFYRKIAGDAKKFLAENGMIFLEINQKLGAETLNLFKNFSESHLIKDLSGNDRFIFVKK